MEHILQPLPENLDEKMEQARFIEAKLAVENARKEAGEKLEQEKREALPAHIKAEEEILGLIDDEVCDCQDIWELRQGIEKIFRKYF